MKQLLFLSVILFFTLLVGGCGTASVSPVKKDDGGKGKRNGVRYVHLVPTNMALVSTPTPTYTFERDRDRTSSIVDCSTLNNPPKHNVHVEIVKTGTTATSDGTAQVVLQQTVQVPDDCRFQMHLPLQLEEYVGYAWRVTSDDQEELQPHTEEWHTFVYAQNGVEDATAGAPCENNIVRDWTFFRQGALQWQTVPVGNFTPITQAMWVAQGDGDNGAGVLQTPQTVLFQNLRQPIVQGKRYRLKFSLKHNGKNDFQVKAIAFNGVLDSLEADSNKSIIGFTGTITGNGSWFEVVLPVWQANRDFDNLAIAIVNDANTTLSALIDKVCLVETNDSGCGDTEENMGLVPDGFDLDSSNPVITQFEYLNGAVEELYPGYDTTTANWYEEYNASQWGCSSIGGELSDEEEAQIDLELVDPELDQALEDLNNSLPTLLQTAYGVDNNSSDMNLTPIVNTYNPEKCKPRIVDPSKPFSGRDIVYIHGLQIDALKSNLTTPQRFQEKWPQDWQRFYSGGDIIKKARSYWAKHIQRELGALYDPLNDTFSTPTNSFAVVSWSANQRVRYAIHAVLTQIRDAMTGNNPNVYLSERAQNAGQCFGDNGIVVITHSTGGLIASAMFGIAERSNDPGANITGYGKTVNIHNSYGDVRFITDKIDAQIGLNAAYGGSPFASKALEYIGAIYTSPIPIISIAGGIADYFLGGMASFVNMSNWETFFRSSLVDLMPEVAAERWRPWQASAIPTLILSSAYLAKSDIGSNIGKRFITGFDDLVLSPSSQTASYIRKPRFKVKNKGKLKDKGVAEDRADGLIKDGKKASGTGKRNFFNTPYVAPTGMLQGNSVQSLVDPTNYTVPNHHLVLQTAGNHFDNVNELDDRFYDYTKSHSLTNEETAIVFNPALYSQGLLSQSFGTLNREWIRKEAWGFYLPHLKWKYRQVRIFGQTIGMHIPYWVWQYHEIIKWLRKYHLLEGYKEKVGADYMYEYVLKP